MDNEPRPTAPTLPKLPAHTSRYVAAVAACLLLFAGGYAIIRWSLDNGEAADPPSGQNERELFVGWQKPDFVLVLSGQTFGYLQPCGCSPIMYGGLARRWELINSLRKKGWQVVPVDVGDLYPNQKNLDTPTEQNLLKYETAMRTLQTMGYEAIGIGKQELNVPLVNALAQFSINNPRPRPLAANLGGVEEGGVLNQLNARPYHVVDIAGLPKIGVLGIVGKTVQDGVKVENFRPNIQVLPGILKELQQQTEFNIVLFQSEDRVAPGVEPEVDKCVAWCADQKLAPVHVALYSSDDPEPPATPRDLRGAQVITVGHKGKYVGVLGVWRKGGKVETRYELVLMGPELGPHPNNPVSKLMEDYSKRVMDQNLMAKFLFTPHQVQVLLRNHKIDTKYAGSERCADCHDDAHKVWAASGHSHGFQTLIDAKNPGLRQHDGECVQCHTVGFKHDWGFNDPRHQEKMKMLLRNVGCESCHGPASAHVNNPKDMNVRKLINPWAKHFNDKTPEHVRLQRINTFCQNCHDIENDVHWDFNKKWPKVIHMTPKGAKE